MKEKKLLRALGNVDNQYIKEAEPMKKTSKIECCVMASPPAEKGEQNGKNQQGRYELCKGKKVHRF